MVSARGIELTVHGEKDVYLTSPPEVNYLKLVQRRYVPFSADYVQLITNSFDFGKRIACDIPRIGHFLSKLYLYVKLPALPDACWTDTLGYAIFDGPIELDVNGTVIDRLYPDLLNIQSEYIDNEKHARMILKSDSAISTPLNAVAGVELMIPLPFWFTKSYGMAFPMHLLTAANGLTINFKFRPFQDLVCYSGSAPTAVAIQDVCVFAEYIFVDESCIVDTYPPTVIERSFTVEDEHVSGQTFTSIVNQKDYLKEIFFAAVKLDEITTNNYFNYGILDEDGIGITPIIKTISVQFDTITKIDWFPEIFYRTVLADRHTVVPNTFVYCIPFALHPDLMPVSGSFNNSAFAEFRLGFTFTENNPDCLIKIFTVNYSVLKFENGLPVFY